MFTILDDKSKTICITRGDVGNINVSAVTSEGEPFVFITGDVIRLQVFVKKACDNIVLTKEVVVDADTVSVVIRLSSEDTRIGEIINKPVDYWYEIELNPDTEPQTIVGYDEKGEKIFRLYPEGVPYE